MKFIASAVANFLFLLCVSSPQGWYIVTYALGIYHLNLFIAFLSPKVDPSLLDDGGESPSANQSVGC